MASAKAAIKLSIVVVVIVFSLCVVVVLYAPHYNILSAIVKSKH